MRLWILLLTFLTFKFTFAESQIGAMPFSPGNTAKNGSALSSSISKSHNAPLLLNLGTGLALIRGSAGFGFNIGAAYKILTNHPLYLGADFGFSTWGFKYYYYDYFDAYNISVSAFHFLITTKYIYNLENKLKLTGGLSLGPSFSSSNLAYLGGTYFTFLLRPGIQFDISKNFLLGVETNFGIVGTSFAFYPLISAIFSM